MSFITQQERPQRKSLFSRCFEQDIHRVPQVPASAPIQTPPIPHLQPSYAGAKLLVLDLDETLVHSSFQAVLNADFKISIRIDEPIPQYYTVFVYKRPYLELFLQTMSQHYDICVFTASLQAYCDAVMDQIDPGNLCKLRLYRHHCTIVNGLYLKDIYALGYSPQNVVIIDNSSISFGLQPANGILCSAYYNDSTDTYLKDCIPYLVQLSKCADVREGLKGNM